MEKVFSGWFRGPGRKLRVISPRYESSDNKIIGQGQVSGWGLRVKGKRRNIVSFSFSRRRLIRSRFLDCAPILLQYSNHTKPYLHIKQIFKKSHNKKLIQYYLEGLNFYSKIRQFEQFSTSDCISYVRTSHYFYRPSVSLSHVFGWLYLTKFWNFCFEAVKNVKVTQRFNRWKRDAQIRQNLWLETILLLRNKNRLIF